MIENGMAKYDPALGRAIGSVNLEDYIPLETPAGANGMIWKQLRQLGRAIPGMFWGLYLQDKAMDEYLAFIEDIMVRYDEENGDAYLPDADFQTVVKTSMEEWASKAVSSMARIIAGYWSRYRLQKLFQGQEGADDLLISLCMDLKGNPTSEMSHAMLRLASMPEIQNTESSKEFFLKLQEEGVFSIEFVKLYNDFMKRYGCRGMKEIDVASPRTTENPAELFDRLKRIDIEHNAIINVSQRRKEARDKLLDMATAMGKESTFLYHDHVIQSLLGYREHPKYICELL